MQIAILLGSYNGAKYIQEQLDSFAEQSHSDWSLWVSDDGSTDNTVSIVKKFALRVVGNRVHQQNGPRKGFAANFLSMVCNPDLKADAYAYSDQDDIWMRDKLERAAQFLSSVQKGVPALYCSRTLYVDEDNKPLKLSQSYLRPALFANALVQNIASGNTMVFNDAARALLINLGADSEIDLHDWLTYMLITGAGGKVFFDQKPSVRYRQHSKNLIGMNNGIRAKIGRIQMLFRGRFKDWNERHVAALKRLSGLLTPQNIAILEQFAKARKSKGISRLVGLKRSGVYRQTPSNNIAFYIAAMVGKV
jgi:glycosyltransferase involved in cell wall biosynthesis